MPNTARRPLIAAAVSVFIVALICAQAFGGSVAGVTLPQLQTPAGLGGGHVSTPSVPPIKVPSVPAAPAVPAAGAAVQRVVRTPSAPSVPAVRTPAAASGTSGSASAAATGSSSTSGSGSGSSGSGAGSGSSHGVSAASHAKSNSPAARSHRRAARERRLRNVVHRYAGCLTSLDGQEQELLSLRAGIDSAPISRAAAADRLGITRQAARSLERGGLRHLRAAGRSGQCGSSGAGGGAAANAIADSSHLPQLQPTVFLTPRPALTTPAKLAAREGHQAVKGARYSSDEAQASTGSGSGSGGSPPAMVHGSESASTDIEYLIAVAGLALLMALVLIAWRRRNMGRQPGPQPATNVWWPTSTGDFPEAPAPQSAPVQMHAEAAAAGAALAEPEPGVESETAAEPEPVAMTEPAAPPAESEPSGPRPVVAPVPSRPTAQQQAQRHPVAVVAASLVSLGVTALLGRRRRRR